MDMFLPVNQPHNHRHRFHNYGNEVYKLYSFFDVGPKFPIISGNFIS